MRFRLWPLLLSCLLGAPPASADPDVTLFSLNLWHWITPAQLSVPALMDRIDDLPTPGAGGPDFLTLQEVSLPLVETELAARGYFFVAEPNASTGIGKVTASKTPPHFSRGTNQLGEACAVVCDIVEMCTLVGPDPVCVLNVHSQAWQIGPTHDAYREDLSRTLVARTRELARGGFLVLVAGDFNAPVDAFSIELLESAGLTDAWLSLAQIECSEDFPKGCTFVDNAFEGNIIPGDIPDAFRRIDHLYSFGSRADDSWTAVSVLLDESPGEPRVSGQNALFGSHGGSGTHTAFTPEGEYDVGLTCTSGCAGLYPHRMRITSWNPVTGGFSGTGFYRSDPGIQWTVEGTISGSSFQLEYDYLPPNAGFVGTAAGTLDASGAPVAGTGGSPTHNLSYIWAATRRPLPIRARYTVDMTLCGASGCPGTTNRHTMDVTSWNPTTGVFTGRGWWNADPDVTWTATGSVTGTRFELAFTYDGAGYAADVVGALGDDGSLHFGLGTDNAAPANHFAFEATAVPEPMRAATAAAAALALVALAARSRRRAEG